jgi:hypothetical protein
MDVSKILEELRQEREQLEEAILSLERLARGRGSVNACKHANTFLSRAILLVVEQEFLAKIQKFL